MKPIENFENVEVKEFEDFKVLTLGGHEVVIKEAIEYTGMTGNTSLRVSVDIANGEFKGFFQEQFDRNKNADKKWPSGGVKYISLKEDEKCVQMFKAFTTAVENSNKGYKWDWNETKLAGKKLAGVFGWEEYESNDGTIKTATKLTQFRSLDKLADIKIPKVKMLDGTYVDVDDYSEMKLESLNKTYSKVDTDEELPF